MLNSPYKKPYITPPNSHPRLMVRREDVERVKNNIALPECKLAVELWQKLCQMPILCEGATPDYGTYDLAEYLALEAKALKALLSENEADARDAIDSAIFLLENSEFDKGIMKARWSGHLIFSCSLVYDWCYSYLSDKQKSLIITKCEQMAEKYFEMGYPPAKQAAISGHGAEAQLLRDLLSLGIASYDERPDIYDFCAGRIIDEYVPSYDYMFAGGFHHQGPAYGSYRYTCLLWGELLLYSMSGKKVFTDKLGELAESFLYLTRPDGESLRLGDEFFETKAPYTRNAPFAMPMFFAAAYTGDERYKKVFLEGLDVEYLVPTHRGIDYYDGGSYGEGLFSPVAYLVWNNLSPKIEEKVMKPYKYFGSPNGITIWNDGERVVLMKIGELWGSNHDHLDTGCFQVYCGGALASDSGVYDSYHTWHRRNYTTRTSAHNCLTVFDPERPRYDEWREGHAYDGGTRRPRAGNEPKTLDEWRENYKMATVISHTESEELCEIVGDMTEAYSHTCEKAVRKMTWQPKRAELGVLTVEDEVITKSKDFISAFHIHCLTEPTLIDNGAVIDNGSYKLVCRVVSPANAKIELVGGPGREFEVDGVNYPTDAAENTEAGWGQIIITDTDSTTHKSFKIEMEIVKGN